IKGWEGAVALSTEADAGCIASNRFLSYTPIENQIDVRWARWYFLSNAGNELLQRASPGSADRNRTLAINRFEALEIPLPPVEKQRLVAQRLDELAARSSDALRYLSAAQVTMDALMPSLRRQAVEPFSALQRPLGEVVHVEMGQSPPGNAYNDRGEGLP